MTTRRNRILCACCAVVVAILWTGDTRAAVTTTGEVNPTNPGAWTSQTLASVGNTSDGSLWIDEGSQIASNYSYLGYSSGSLGEATLADLGSYWRSHQSLIVGNSGQGRLTVEQAATVRSRDGFVGALPGSIGFATITGAGSRWDSDNGLLVGLSGAGTLEVSSGATVESVYGHVGDAARATAR